ncbi:hypothetical protein CC1G_08068 [Coprinopsis cinerea okayama7|uniref:Secreted protein n=1 Tax=Coprinopsis cinerea (strain Okayama-7 / 130 / ATCC MYA-4618 / FGSC 9003) TaxID=240176 RepID=A8NVM1_COPC7|nr:hypothetical protein CC1G_08068 [Coprinopsis cinerea okayama7\|eukprot:XP_001836683.1 hypothetical protein CC1G_08068 [Coprinopsis cinerea okayama7\
MVSSLARFAAISALALGAIAADGAELKLKSVGAIGTGCPPGTVVGRVNKDDSLSLFFAKFRADAGPTFDLSEGRTNCQLTLDVDIPAGYQFAFDKTVLNTAYAVDSKVDAISKTYYYFQGQLDQATGSATVSGPASGSGTVTHKFSPTIWSPCGSSAIVGINTSLRIDNGNSNARGHIAVRNSTDASFIWRKC